VVQAAALLGKGDLASELLGLINPVRQAATPDGVARYRVEPYVAAGDVYGGVHAGRGGWTWYTGSASWLYRVALETVLGFHLRGNRLALEPCVPRGWPSFEITYRYRSAIYHITVANGGTGRLVGGVTVDGQMVEGGWVALADDGRRHEIRVVLS
jgi:cyclic beta-1,2-glucan synthetase